MDKLIAAICLCAVLAMFAMIGIYLKADGLKFRADALLDSFDEDFSGWLEEADKLFSAENAEFSEYGTLKKEMQQISRKQKREIVPMMNRAHVMVKQRIVSAGTEETAAKTGYRLTEIYREFGENRNDYNDVVRCFNALLNGKVTGIVGRITGQKPLEILNDLSVL